MSRYTYTIHRDRKSEPDEKHFYRMEELLGMTSFQLREICHKEKLVLSSVDPTDREDLVRLIMRFRGQASYRHIDTDCEGGIERLQEFFDGGIEEAKGAADIRLPGTIVLYSGIGLDDADNYLAESKGRLYEGNLFLADENYRIYTCLYLKEKNGLFYLHKGKDVPILPLGKHQYSILFFPNDKASEYLYDRYYGNNVKPASRMDCVRIPLLDIELREIQEVDLPLVIDFGSSNTTTGICLSDGSVRIIRSEGSCVIPSVIGVKEVDGDRPGFVFGREAVNLNRKNYLDQDVTVFYDVKRWVSDADRTEGVILRNGFKYQVPRKEMLREFLAYLIELAKQQFKCRFHYIQMLAPIRQKEKFQKFFKELLPEYEVDCVLDEGMAVLFHSISSLVSQNLYEKNRWYHSLIIDCGGGTTDLTSGRFRIDNNRVSYTVDLQTSYENGDTNFGGNNLSYRVLQLLKVRIVKEMGAMEPGKTEIVQGPDPYLRLEEEYRRAEEFLPTRFKEYEDQSRDQYFYVKNNYYYLFELAEQVKKYFFQPSFQYELSIGTGRSDYQKQMFLDKWRLSVRQGDSFGRLRRDIEFTLYLNEIEELLRPDIYGLMERFLDKKFEQGSLQGYEMIKLTGQSCKSRLFTEALKQYVPGKLIRNTRMSDDGEELKMCCLEGALSYFLNCKLGYMKVNRSYQVGALPYEITAFTHENKEMVLVRSRDREGHIGFISRFMIGRQLDLYLNDEQGKRLRTYYFEYDASKFKKTDQGEIDRLYGGTVIQQETDTIMEGEMKFFIWVCTKRWGFLVLPILREGELLYIGEETFFDFEDDTWEQNFYDGRK